ncbi:MAG: GNAT family N-acetyltransferase [Planctomycetota bacterium]|nr:GNAT family N-acetyltransferase [Planctomycetota bacterium]
MSTPATPPEGKRPVVCRVLTLKDIPGAQRLRELAKWNQTDEDWKNLIAFEPQGCFAVEMDGKVVGTATSTRFAPNTGAGSFGWIGMVLVDPEYRRHGIGSTLLKHCIAYLQGQGVETVRLDATPMGKKVYDQLGFVDEYSLERWEGTAQKVPGGVLGPWSLTPPTEADLPALAAYDTPVFGADRGAVLAAWRAGWPELAAVAREGANVRGYVLARRGANFHQIGPVIGDDPGVCEALAMYALERLAGQRVVMDLVTANDWAVPMATRCGLRHQRPFIRMALGKNSRPGSRGKVMAICCPELG